MTILPRLILATAFAVGAVASAQMAYAQKATPAQAAAKPAKKAASPCKGLSQSACSANASCGWVTPKKKVSTNGRKLSAYCRKVAGIAKKK